MMRAGDISRRQVASVTQSLFLMPISWATWEAGVSLGVLMRCWGEGQQGSEHDLTEGCDRDLEAAECLSWAKGPPGPLKTLFWT